MKGEHNQHNRILPVKSLIQNSKQNKRQYIQFIAKDTHNISGEIPMTPKGISHHSHSIHLPTPTHEKHRNPQHPSSQQKNRGLSNDHNIGFNDLQFDQKRHEIGPKGYRLRQDIYNPPKTDRPLRQQLKPTLKTNNFMAQLNKKQSSADFCSRKSDASDNEEKTSFMNMINDRRESFKSVSLNRDSSELQRDQSQKSDKFSGKLQDQTWNVSKFDRALLSERQSQPIYKNQLTKIKTQLFQKEASLFEYSQKLEERENTIKDLTIRLELMNNLNTNLKIQARKQGDDEEKKKLILEVEKLNKTVAILSSQLNKKRNQDDQEDEDLSTNKKIMHLKLKQYELDQKQKTQYIIELKEKEKKSIENYEKILGGQKELMRQKQEQLKKISQAAHFYKEEVSKNIKQIQALKVKYTEQIDIKKEVIKDLSGQLGDLKNCINQLQIRMREMMNNEEELRKQLQASKKIKPQCIVANSLQAKMELERKNQEIIILEVQNKELFDKIRSGQVLQRQRKQQLQEAKRNFSAKEFQLSIISRTCEEYQRKIDEYHKYSEQMRKQIEIYKKSQKQIKRTRIERDQQITIYKSKCGEKSDRSKETPRKSVSPLKEGTVDQKEYQKLKQANVKLVKDNQKLNSIVKNLDAKVYQFYKLNKELNQEIVNRQIEEMNQKFSGVMKS